MGTLSILDDALGVVKNFSSDPAGLRFDLLGGGVRGIREGGRGGLRALVLSMMA